ncbi:MAG: hypothetical protein HON23_07415 [Rickettsiales bacterium]|nr:hypothetical protein [Rickettsiales bacterium]
MSTLLLITSLLLSLLCTNLRAEEALVFEYEDAAPVPRQINIPNANKTDYGPLHVDQYEGDHSFWWYEANQKKYRFYMGMSLPYNIGGTINDISVDSLTYPTDITDSSNNIIIGADTNNFTDTTTNITSGDGIGFAIKTGVEYRELIRFDVEIGTKRLFLDEMDAIGDTFFDLSTSDTSLMFNYIGANLALEWPRGMKSISPFIGFGVGGGYFSTSGLGDDFVPYVQASMGMTYRFNKSVALELFATSVMITSDFTFSLDYPIDSAVVGGTTYTDLDANAEINFTYDNAASGDYVINSVVIAYRFLF